MTCRIIRFYSFLEFHGYAILDTWNKVSECWCEHCAATKDEIFFSKISARWL